MQIKDPHCRVVVIGAGFSGLSCACHLAKKGFKVTVLEKNDQPGGRARSYSEKGFTWDMGPSWYWMPDVFDRFFHSFRKKTSDYYELERLDPSYRVKFKEDVWDIPASMDEIEKLFESVESGSSKKLRKFLNQAKFKYEVGVKKLVYKPSRSLVEFIDLNLLLGLLKMDVFTSIAKACSQAFQRRAIDTTNGISDFIPGRHRQQYTCPLHLDELFRCGPGHMVSKWGECAQ